jgi:hypothetical protein
VPGRRLDRRAFRPALHQLVEIVDPDREDDAVDDDNGRERPRDRAERNRRQRIAAMQDAVGHPGLTADLRREPPREDRDEPERPRMTGDAQEPRRIE